MSHWRNSSEVFHRRAREYDSWFDDSLLFAIELAAVRTLAAPLPHPALEIGVGPGRFAQALGTDYGIDPAFAPLLLARKRSIAATSAIGEQLPFRDETFASVLLLFTFCFLQDHERVLAEVRRILAPNGRLILGFVPATGAWGQTLQAKKEADHPFYRHARFFAPDEVTALLAHQGFAPASAVSTLFQPPEGLHQMETPQAGMDEQAGFIVLTATVAGRAEKESTQ